MHTIAVLLVALGLLGVLLGAGVICWLRTDLLRLERRAADIAGRVEALPGDLSRVFGNRDRHVISVELLNLFELAHRESWLARPLTVLAPRTLSDAIHRRLVAKVRESLAASGVQADVRLHRAR